MFVSGEINTFYATPVEFFSIIPSLFKELRNNPAFSVLWQKHQFFGAQVYNVVIHSFGRLYFIYSYYEIFGGLPGGSVV